MPQAIATINAERQSVGNLIQQAQNIRQQAVTENRALRSDEATQLNSLMDQVVIKRQLIAGWEQELNVDRAQQGMNQNRPDAPRVITPEMRNFDRFLRGQISVAEIRDLSAGQSQEGGYLVPTEFRDDLIKELDNLLYIRMLANVDTIDPGSTIEKPRLDGRMEDWKWTAEVAQAPRDTEMAFGLAQLTPNLLSRRVLVSRALVHNPRANIEAKVRSEMAYKMAVPQEYGFMAGNGAGLEPLGVFFPSEEGIPTNRDFGGGTGAEQTYAGMTVQQGPGGNTETAITFEGLNSALYALKAQYRRSMDCAWMFHRESVRQLSILTDKDGHLIWRTSARSGEPDTLMQIPFYESEYAPSLKSANPAAHSLGSDENDELALYPNNATNGRRYVGIVGCWKFYWVVDSTLMEIQRLEELYAGTNQVGFIGRMYTTGAPVLAEAFARVQLAD